MGDTYRDARQSSRDTLPPPGVAIVSLGVVVYGLLWTLTGLRVFYGVPRPAFPALATPFVGMILVLAGVGLWERNWLAWTVTVVTVGALLVWELLQMTALSLGAVPFGPALVLAYLTFRRELYLDDAG